MQYFRTIATFVENKIQFIKPTAEVYKKGRIAKIVLISIASFLHNTD